jgi:hypothetical protein
MTQCQSEGCDAEAVPSIPFLGVPLLVCAAHTPPLEQLTDAPMCYKDDSPASCGTDRSNVPMSEIHDTIPAEPTVDLDPAAVNGVADDAPEAAAPKRARRAAWTRKAAEADEGPADLSDDLEKRAAAHAAETDAFVKQIDEELVENQAKRTRLLALRSKFTGTTAPHVVSMRQPPHYQATADEQAEWVRRAAEKRTTNRATVDPKAKPARKRGPGKRVRRTEAQIAEGVAAVMKLIAKSKTGLRAEEIRKQSGLERKELPAILKAIVEQKLASVSGRKRATCYKARA